jgi:dCMP deaminase
MVTPRDLRWLKACELLAPTFSTCERRQYVAFLIDATGRVAGFGYNGSPPSQPHCADAPCPRLDSKVAHGSRYDTDAGRCIAVHAEANALLYAETSRRAGGTMYVNGPPCADCAKLMAASGVMRVVHLRDDSYPDACAPVGIHAIALDLEQGQSV